MRAVSAPVFCYLFSGLHSIMARSERVVGFTVLGLQLVRDSTRKIARDEPRGTQNERER
jgi:hypothetical protein